VKKLFITFIISIIHFVVPTTKRTYAQALDTLRYTQESGTLEKQEFVDESEDFFLTKFSMKDAWKYGSMSASGLSNLFSASFTSYILSVAYERKLTNALSIQIQGLMQPVPLGATFQAHIEPRWYYRQATKIRSGEAANNLSGAYLAFRGSGSYNITDSFDQLNKNSRSNNPPFSRFNTYSITASWGRQHFFRTNNSAEIQWADAAIVAGYGQDKDAFLTATSLETRSSGRWFIQTEVKIGAMWGAKRWLRSNALIDQSCVLFRCLEEQFSMWKFDLGRMLYASTDIQRFLPSVAFEHKINKSAFSISHEFQLGYERYNLPSFESYKGLNLQRATATYTFEPRYYPSLNENIASGKSANNLSGTYLALGYSTQQRFDLSNTYNDPNSWIAATYGRQQRFLKRGFYETRITLGKYLQKPLFINTDWIFNIGLRMGLAY